VAEAIVVQAALKPEIIELTPEFAADLLASAKRNRPVSPKLVKSYARDMAEDRWSLNGETIKVNKQGLMFDGKHRCMACIEAGRPVRVLIVWDAEEENVDTGRPRTYADILAMDGVAYARQLSAAVNQVTVWMDGGRPGLSASYRATTAEKDQILTDNPGILNSVIRVNQLRTKIPVQPSVLALCHWLFTSISPGEAEQFFLDLSSGAGMEDGDPVLTLRNRIIRERLNRRGAMN